MDGFPQQSFLNTYNTSSCTKTLDLLFFSQSKETLNARMTMQQEEMIAKEVSMVALKCERCMRNKTRNKNGDKTKSSEKQHVAETDQG